MPNDKQTLAQTLRAKYPGAYDDLSDVDLEQKVLGKYPQYGDMPLTPGTKFVQGTPPGGLPPVPTPNPQDVMKPNYATQQLLGSDPNMQLRSMQPGLPAAGQDPRVAAAGLGAAGIAGAATSGGAAISALTAPTSARILEKGAGEDLKYIIEQGPSRLKQISEALSDAEQSHPAVAKIIKWGLIGLGLRHSGGILKAIGAGE